MFRPVSLSATGANGSDGDEAPLPASAVLGSSMWLDGSGRAAAAVEIFRDVIATHPDTWVGYACLGHAQVKLGERANAAASYQ